MKAFSPAHLINESVLKVDSLNSLTDRRKTKTQLMVEANTNFDKQVRDAKKDYYKVILASESTKYDIDHAKQKMQSKIAKIEAQRESFIHGIDVDANSIFDNGNDDFNRTEWMDLTLESSYKLDRDLANIALHGFVEEALVWIDESASFGDIDAVQEAVVSRIRGAVNKTIEVVKRIIAKFAEKLKAIGTNNAPYLKKYKATILQQQPKSEIIKIKDFETAIKRIMSVSVPNIQYAQLKSTLTNVGQDEDVQQVIFDKLIRNKIMGNIQSGQGDTIADICKNFFQCAEQSPLIERDMQTFNMTNIYNFLIDANKLVTQVQKDMKALESNANLLLSAAEKESNAAPQQNNQQPAPAQQAQSESARMFGDREVYSVVMESYVTLQEFEAVKQEPKDGSMAGRMNNVSGDGYKDQAAADSDANAAGGATPQTRNEVAAYVKVMQTVLGAKMTSIEFFQRELFKLVRHHVGNFIQGETQETSAQTGTI